MKSLKEIREEKEYSQQMAADILGVPYRTYQNWELGLRNPPSYVLKMAIEKLTNSPSKKIPVVIDVEKKYIEVNGNKYDIIAGMVDVAAIKEIKEIIDKVLR